MILENADEYFIFEGDCKGFEIFHLIDKNCLGMCPV
jgi:hypothetical protein